jgi:polar amino acid transport system substrate-binding protein
MMQSHRRRAIAALLTMLAGNAAMADDKIILLYNERIPYMETQANGDVAGLTATPAKLAFTRAGIPFEWKKLPTVTQLQWIQGNQKKACMIGWYKNSDREKIGKFSHAIYEDRQILAVGLATNPKFGDDKSARELVDNRQLVLLVKEGYSYGHVIDELISSKSPRISVTVGENINMLSMLIYKRADYFFVGEDEASELMRRSGHNHKDFKILHFANILHEDPRRLWCTSQVPDATMEKLNAEVDRIWTKR